MYLPVGLSIRRIYICSTRVYTQYCRQVGRQVCDMCFCCMMYVCRVARLYVEQSIYVCMFILIWQICTCDLQITLFYTIYSYYTTPASSREPRGGGGGGQRFFSLVFQVVHYLIEYGPIQSSDNQIYGCKCLDICKQKSTQSALLYGVTRV